MTKLRVQLVLGVIIMMLGLGEGKISGSGVMAEIDFLQGAITESTAFVCSTTPTTECELTKYNANSMHTILNRTYTRDTRFKVRDLVFCIIDLNYTKVDDLGEYHCITDVEYRVYYLQVQRPTSKLFYNNKLWTNNSEHSIDPNDSGYVTFKCVTYLQNNCSGSSNFIWLLDNNGRQNDYKIKTLYDDLLEYESNIKIHFKEGEKGKEVKCKIKSASGQEILVGTFGVTYATDTVVLQDNSDNNHRIILEDEGKQITCEGNGYPLPRDFLIEKEGENGVWEVIVTQSSLTITDSGTYACEARNHFENGTEMGHYIISNKLTFRNYDSELKAMTRTLTAMSDVVTELHKQQVVTNQTLTDMNDKMSEIFNERASLNISMLNLSIMHTDMSRIISEMTVKLHDLSTVQRKILRHFSLNI
uniref:Ig-like domain-containing protein n=1 Tax=Strigamia maritima TaxID=126957 RepID=T1J025_STRMM